jgi:uncharacterized protein (DUF58 family)
MPIPNHWAMAVPLPGPGAEVTKAIASEGEVLSSLEDTWRIYLTWPRALLLAAALAALLGGRGAWALFAVLGLVLWTASAAVGAAARGLSLRYDVLDEHVYSGAAARVRLVVSNRGRWPAPLLLVQGRLPEGLHGQCRRVLSLGPRSEHRVEFQVLALRRGVYRLGDTRVIVSDWFGLFEETADVPVPARLVVFPHLPVLPVLPARRRLPTGPRRDPTSPFRDELPAGVRPYVPGDPLRSIAWKQTARRGQLVVRDFPLVREAASWVFLDLCAQDWDPHSRHELTELAISVAAALVWSEALDRRPVGLATWGALAQHTIHGMEQVAPPSWLQLPPRTGPRQAIGVLETLAAVRPAEGADFLGHLRQAVGQLPWGAHLLLLVPRDTPELWQMAATWRARGHPVSILCFERRLGRPSGLVAQALPEVVEVHARDGLEYR